MTTITYVSVRQRRWLVIIRHLAACNFSLDGLLFCEIGLDLVVGVALQWLLVPIHALHAQAMFEVVAPELKIGSW